MKPYRIIISLFIIVTILFLLAQNQAPLINAGIGTPTSFVFLPTILQPEATPTTNDLTSLSDQFEDGLIDNAWTVFNASDFSQNEAGGYRYIVPLDKVTWYKENNGPFLYKLVDGDFKLTTRVMTGIEKPLDLSRPYQYAGIMMRDPSSDSTGLENYVFDVVGMHIDELAVETKSTLDDVSDAEQDKLWDDANADLRICRLGSNFYLYKRHIGETSWTLERSFNRPDIGSTVQAGMIAYAQNNDPDLNAGFEYVEFSRINSLSDCTTD